MFQLFLNNARFYCFLRTVGKLFPDSVLIQHIGEALGRGAFGVVYKGLNFETGETVAIKRYASIAITQILFECLLFSLSHFVLVKGKSESILRLKFSSSNIFSDCSFVLNDNISLL
jgi:serine/threonine protein kinase